MVHGQFRVFDVQVRADVLRVVFQGCELLPGGIPGPAPRRRARPVDVERAPVPEIPVFRTPRPGPQFPVDHQHAHVLRIGVRREVGGVEVAPVLLPARHRFSSVQHGFGSRRGFDRQPAVPGGDCQRTIEVIPPAVHHDPFPVLPRRFATGLQCLPDRPVMVITGVFARCSNLPDDLRILPGADPVHPVARRRIRTGTIRPASRELHEQKAGQEKGNKAETEAERDHRIEGREKRNIKTLIIDRCTRILNSWTSSENPPEPGERLKLLGEER